MLANDNRKQRSLDRDRKKLVRESGERKRKKGMCVCVCVKDGKEKG